MPKTDLEKAAKLGQRIVKLNKAGDSEAAVALCDKLLARFGTKHSQVDMRRQIARALAYKALSLAKLGRLDEAVEASDQLVMTFGGDHDGALDLFTGTIATLMVSQAIELDDNHLALQLCERYVPVLVEGSAASLPPDIVKLVGLQASLLGDLERLDEARSTIDQFLALAEVNPDPALDEHIENARELRDSLTEAAELLLAIDSPHGSDESVAKAALLDTVESWLSVPDGPGPVDSEIAFMRSCAAMYDQLRSTNAELADDPDALVMLQKIATKTLRARTGSRMAATEEGDVPGLSDGVAEAIAAARLAALGQARVVLVTTSIMSQGLDCSGPSWTRQPNQPGHLWLLPAICSALSPDEQFELDPNGSDVPLCSFRYDDQGSCMVQLDPEFRALRPGVSDADRGEFFDWAAGEKAGLLYEDDRYAFPHFCLRDVDTTIELVPEVAAALGINPDSVTVLRPKVPLEQRLTNLRSGVRPESSWFADTDEDDQAAVEFAHLLYWVAGEAHLLLDADEDLTRIAHDHPWVIDWYPSTMPRAVWPPDRDLLRTAIRECADGKEAARASRRAAFVDLVGTFTETELAFLREFFLGHVARPDEDWLVRSIIDKFEAMELPGFNMDWRVSKSMNTVVFTAHDEYRASAFVDLVGIFTEDEFAFMAQFFINNVAHPEEDGVVKSVIDKFWDLELPGFSYDWDVEDVNTIVFRTHD